MYNRLATWLTRKFANSKIIDENKQDIYIYGFEMIISNLVYTIIFLILSLITNSLIASLCFWMGLFFLRKTAGGHHANSYTSCHILFALNHIIFIVLLKVFPLWLIYPSTCFMILFSAILVLLLAPVDHKNKPFIKNEYKRYKLLSKLYSIIMIAILILVATRIINANAYLLGYSFGAFSATISLLYAKIIRITERKMENEELQEFGS